MARLKILGPDDEPQLLEFLHQRIEHSMFLLSNLRAAGWEDHGHPYNGSYVAAFADGRIVGVACHYRRGNVVVNAPDHAVELARAALEASGRPLKAVVGPALEVQAVAAALALPVGDAAQLDESEGLYRLELADLQVPAPLRDGTVRGRELAAADLDLVDAWMIRYRVESAGDPDTPELRRAIRNDHEAALGRGEVWVLEHAGQLVARTGFNARLPEAVQIGGVWTPHELRGRGYARAALAAHLLAIRETGVSTAILFTGESNTPARRAYAALGFRRVGDYGLLLLRAPIRPLG
ncbi:MAG TPA: GNAT family N-acetyltransferase [Enhygromyxa sp.]|nr:GNAT family N-acetyltransferase [Enhygromyxa sp.]